jgi:N-glycosidase YbiA
MMAREGDAPPQVIRFYSVSDEYGEFSNFARYPIQLKGKQWPTSEHYFQAQKFAEVRDQDEIRRASTPMLAAQFGRDRKRKLRRDWESVKLGVMREAVEAKFRQHDELRALLLSTGDAKLVEHTENDDFWGDGGDGRGRNELGRILMSVRDRLRGEVGAT